MKIRTAAYLACLLLAACGQRGDLYLPDEARPLNVPATAEADPDEEEEAQRPPQDPAGNAAGN